MLLIHFFCWSSSYPRYLNSGIFADDKWNPQNSFYCDEIECNFKTCIHLILAANIENADFNSIKKINLVASGKSILSSTKENFNSDKNRGKITTRALALNITTRCQIIKKTSLTTTRKQSWKSRSSVCLLCKKEWHIFAVSLFRSFFLHLLRFIAFKRLTSKMGWEKWVEMGKC